MTTLLEQLAEAKVGNPEIDVALTKAYAPDLVQSDGGGYWIGDEPVTIAPHSTSLDAKLPWENIIISHKIRAGDNYGKWAAIHEAGPLELIEGIAHTEPLARRLAALKGLPRKKGWLHENIEDARATRRRRKGDG